MTFIKFTQSQVHSALSDPKFTMIFIFVRPVVDLLPTAVRSILPYKTVLVSLARCVHLSKCSFLLYGYLVFRVSKILLTPSKSPFFWSSDAPSTMILITCTTPSNISQALSSFVDCFPLSRYSGLHKTKSPWLIWRLALAKWSGGTLLQGEKFT